MRVQGRVRPGRGVSAVGAIVAAAFAIFGLVVIIPLGGPFGLFGTIWTGMTGLMACFHAYNALSEHGIAHEVVDVSMPSTSERSATDSSSGPAASSPADRIRELQELRDEGLISEAEFATEKARILASI